MCDRTYCFYCGIGLQEWTKNNDPWTEHAFLHPRCSFLRMMKGEDFIGECLIKKSKFENVTSIAVDKVEIENKKQENSIDKLTKNLNNDEIDKNKCLICLTNDINIVRNM